MGSANAFSEWVQQSGSMFVLQFLQTPPPPPANACSARQSARRPISDMTSAATAASASHSPTFLPIMCLQFHQVLVNIGPYADPKCAHVLRMASERKAILTSGLGGFATNDPNAQAVFGGNAGAKAQELLQTSIDKANAAGFDLVRWDANPQDPEDTLKRFTQTLQSRKFVGVNIGYGLRGHKGAMILYCAVCPV